MTNSNDALRAALERHYPEGIWAQPCGNRVLVCGCGDILWGVDSSACKAAWRLHILEVTPSPVAGGDLREVIRNLPYDVNDDYDEVRRDERERILSALNQPAAPVEAADDYMRIENAECEGMDKGADFCIKTLVEALGVDDWEQADGSETWHGDVAGTIYNVLKAGRVYDEEDGRVARLEDAHPPEPAASTACVLPDYITVPRQPTDAMYESAAKAWDGPLSSYWTLSIWQAMLEAAPAASTVALGEDDCPAKDAIEILDVAIDLWNGCYPDEPDEIFTDLQRRFREQVAATHNKGSSDGQ